MDKKANANKLISSMVALTLATTLGVPTVALADTGDKTGTLAASSESQPASGDVAGADAASQQGADESQPADNSQLQQGAARSAQAAEPQSGGVAQVGDVTYATLQAAIDNVSDNATVKLLKDTVEDVKIDKTRILNLDLNGHKITNASDNTIFNEGTLVIDGVGTIDNVTHGKAAIYNIGTATLKSGTYERSKEAGVDSSNNGGNSFYTVLNHGTMTVEEGAVVNNKGHFSSLFENGYYSYKAKDGIVKPSLTIKGGTFDGGLNTIKNDDDSTLVVNGGTFKNYTQAALQNYGTATVAGGEFSAESKYAVDNCGSDAVHDPGKLTILGGTFVGELYVHGPYSDVLVSGGEFSGSITADKDSLSVTGGTFTDPGVYQYATSGNVDVTMGKDYSGQVVVPAGVASTLDLNGHKIQHTGTAVINNGTLTVQATNGGTVKSTGNCGIGVGNGSSTTINSGTVESQESSVITSKSCGATININGGTFTAIDNAVVAGNGSDREGNSNTININGGTFNGGITTSEFVACGIYAPWKDTVNVKGGTFNITNGAGIVARAGQVNVSGGTFNTTGNSTGKVGDSRVVVPCSALVFDADAKYPALTNQSAITVTGGTFSSEVVAIATVPDAGSSTTRVSVSGGTFSSDPTVYVASGYEAVKSGANWVVQVPYTPAPAPSTETTTTTNPDGTTTTTVTDKKTGESTSTTEGANGTTVVEKTDASGNTTTKVTVPEGAATNAGAPVEIPAAVEVTKGKEVSISAPAGTIVAIPAAADAGNVAVIVHADGTETVIPMSLVEGGKAIVKLDGDETIKIVDNAKDFSDVPAEHWAADDIDFASSHEIFKGIGNGDTYEPETALTRNMMMTVLARTDGADTSDSDPWYAKGQQWAVDNGVSNGLWGEDSITREQLVTMLFNYANKSGMDTSARADLSGMKNADAVSDWALEAVQWAVAEGILKGVDNTDLAPQGLATRAQAAAFMQRYVKTALL